MNNLYARSVFFVDDAERSLRFYVEQLGFSEDWNVQDDGRTIVCQVSLLGFELILNQTNEQFGTAGRAGHGRVFIGLEDDQVEPLRRHIIEHILAKGIETQLVDWGRPTLVIRDLDANELFLWSSPDDWTALGMPALESRGITLGPRVTGEPEAMQ